MYFQHFILEPYICISVGALSVPAVFQESQFMKVSQNLKGYERLSSTYCVRKLQSEIKVTSV